MRQIDSLRRALLALGLMLFASASALAASPMAGTLEKISVHGKSLAGNLSADTATREVQVYLPPGYSASPQSRYPVIYFLHGFGATASRYAEFLSLPTTIDRAIRERNLQEMIVVIPDAMSPYGGSMYSNSVTTGDWESFVARDLVDYIDANYRTVARREARGLAGHSMGGYGTLRIGMKNPDTFVALYSMSACCLDPRGVNPSDAALEGIASREEVAKKTPFALTTFAASAAWAPNAGRPPFFLDLPTVNGEAQKDVLARYAANAPSVMVSQYAPQLKRYSAIVMDIGLQDGLIGGNKATHEALLRNGVEHVFETYEGDHMNKVAERFERNVLPFFSKQLAGK
jgi:enterochelin esterase-like enzyme